MMNRRRTVSQQLSDMPKRDPRNDRLFRYLSLQIPERDCWARDVFIKHEFYFPSPTNFNDPFDCKVPHLDSLPEKQRKHFVEEFVRRRLGSISRHERRTATKNLSDKQTFIDLTSTIQKNMDGCSLLCSSEQNDDILMWSHYADSHRGICLEFEATTNTPLFGEAQPVEYVETYTDFPLLSDGLEQVSRTMLTKSSHWKYERAWRILRRVRFNEVLPERLRYVGFSSKYLRGVIFGCQCSADTESKVTSWIKEEGCEVTCYRARRKSKEFGLEIVPFLPSH